MLERWTRILCSQPVLSFNDAGTDGIRIRDQSPISVLRCPAKSRFQTTSLEEKALYGCFIHRAIGYQSAQINFILSHHVHRRCRYLLVVENGGRCSLKLSSWISRCIRLVGTRWAGMVPVRGYDMVQIGQVAVLGAPMMQIGWFVALSGTGACSSRCIARTEKDLLTCGCSILQHPFSYVEMYRAERKSAGGLNRASRDDMYDRRSEGTAVLQCRCPPYRSLVLSWGMKGGHFFLNGK